MANPKPKLSPKERLAKVLKQNSNIPELAEFRIQCRDVFRLGGVLGLDEWIDARRDYGLLNHSRHVLKASDDLQGLLGSVIDEATTKPKPASTGLTWDERIELINKREEHARNNVRFIGTKVTLSTSARMQQGFDRLIDEAIAMKQRDVP